MKPNLRFQFLSHFRELKDRAQGKIGALIPGRVKFPFWDYNKFNIESDLNGGGEVIPKAFMHFIPEYIKLLKAKDRLSVQSAPHHSPAHPFILSAHGG